MANRKAVEVTEPEVIDIPLLEDCIIVTGGEEMAAQSKSLPFKEVDWLKLSFKNIVRIENLVGFHALKKLQLDNNRIRKMENLDHLTNLTWLDLSFNQISEIEGIETLTKLTDLCLTHNEITELKGISTLENLEIFSCANNEIATTDDFQRVLRKFQKLRVVNFQNNPVCNDQEYTAVLLAFLSNLKYLDFRLVEDEKVESAKEQYFSDLQSQEQEKAQDAALKKKQEEEAAQEQLYERANMPGVEKLMQVLLEEDVEGDKLTLFVEFQEPLDDYNDAFKETWDAFKTAMLELYDKKVDEKRKFDLNYFGAIESVDQQSKKMISDFKLLKKKCKRRFQEGDVTAAEKEAMSEEVHGRTEELREHLLELEMFQIEQYEDLIMQFEDKYGQIRSKTLDEARVFFEKMRNMQNAYFDKVQERAKELLAKNVAGELPNLNDEAQQVLADKDAFMTSVVAGSHEFRLSKIDGKDEEIGKRENSSYQTLVDGLIANEKERSCTRTDDVLRMIEFLNGESL